MTFSSKINLIARDIRQERKDLGAEKVLTKTHVNFRDQKLELRLKIKGEKQFVELDQFEAPGLEIYESIGLNMEDSERKTVNKNRRITEKTSSRLGYLLTLPHLQIC